MKQLALQAKVDVTMGTIEFSGYDTMLKQARSLAKKISAVEISGESILTSKKLLAEVNKRVTALEQERIRIKNEILVPYLAFEKQIKEITSVVKESDNVLRSKVRELEEIERSQKRSILVNMFNKRIEAYPNLFFLNADMFITAQHVNKATSLNKAEQEMVAWLEQRQREVDLINNTVDANLEVYAETLDLVAALPKTVEPIVNTVVTPDKLVTIKISESDLSQVHLFMKMNGISYTVEKE